MRQALVVLLSAGLACAAGCKRPAAEAPRLHVRVIDVQVADLTPRNLPFAGAAAQDDLIQAARRGLLRAGLEVAQGAPEQPRGDFRLRLELRLEEVRGNADTEGKSLVRAVARGRLQAPRAPAPAGPAGEKGGKDEQVPILRFEQDAVAEKAVAGVPDKGAFAAHALRITEDTVLALGQQAALLSADRGTLLSMLERRDMDSDLRGVAIRVLGARQDREAVPALLPLLKDPEMEIRDKTIGALLQIGDRRAVKALCASAQFQDTFELGKILEAVATLGGEEARAYLEFVASGHQSEQIRGEAKRALARLLASERD
jgi:hypothetical protein